jgi:hypothetical protein
MTHGREVTKKERENIYIKQIPYLDLSPAFPSYTDVELHQTGHAAAKETIISEEEINGGHGSHRHRWCETNTTRQLLILNRDSDAIPPNKAFIVCKS